MTAPIPPVTTAHAEGITATEQDAISAVEDALRYAQQEAFRRTPGIGLPLDEVARAAVAAAAPIIAAAERARCVAVVLAQVEHFQGDGDERRLIRLALRSTARKLDPVTPEQAARALEAHHDAAIARAGTSKADR